MLQHIAEPQGVSWTLVNQIVFGKSVKTLKLLSVKLLWSWWPNEEIISIDPDRASSNIGCKNSLHTQLRKDYPFIISFWCTCHRLELAIKDSVRAAVILKNAQWECTFCTNKVSSRLVAPNRLYFVKSIQIWSFFWTVFSRIGYSVQIRENKDHNKTWYFHSFHTVLEFSRCWSEP